MATLKAHDTAESSHPGRLIGSARVSTTSQGLEVALRGLAEEAMDLWDAEANDVMRSAPTDEKEARCPGS